MAHTDRQTDRQTDGHGDSMTNSAQRGRVGENQIRHFSTQYKGFLFTISSTKPIWLLSWFSSLRQTQSRISRFLLGFMLKVTQDKKNIFKSLPHLKVKARLQLKLKFSEVHYKSIQLLKIYRSNSILEVSSVKMKKKILERNITFFNFTSNKL